MAVLRKIDDERYEIDYGNMNFSLYLKDGRLTAKGGGSSSIIIDDGDWDDYTEQAELEANKLFLNREFTDEIYADKTDPEILSSTVIDINDNLKRYFARNPEKLYDLSSRKFEELIADILHDFGFDVELTQATRDGGKDIYAYLRNQVCSFLMFVECKKYGHSKHVGVDAVRSLYGVQQLNKANKAMIVTTSFFTWPAKDEVVKCESLMILKDYDDLKKWLKRYQ